MAEDTPAFRIAFRTNLVDGHEWWVAYLARMDTMDDSLELGAIRRSAVENPNIRAAFMETMRLMLADVLEEKGIKVSEWKTERPA
jgi:hypothetical protein